MDGDIRTWNSLPLKFCTGPLKFWKVVDLPRDFTRGIVTYSAPAGQKKQTQSVYAHPQGIALAARKTTHNGVLGVADTYPAAGSAASSWQVAALGKH